MSAPAAISLASGAEARVSNELGAAAVVLVNGGRASEVPGTWSATLEWLVRRLAPRFPELAFVEVRYRVKSWRRLDACVADAAAALDAVAGRRCLLVGFSMGGAVAVSVAGRPEVQGVIGLAPWLPPDLPLEPLRGRRLAVAHGSLDRSLPGIPGVTAASSKRGFERAERVGLRSSAYAVIAGGVHGTALRTYSGRLVPLPRASRWLSFVADELAPFARG